MLDPFTSLATAIQTKPGGYALLLGSGVSRSSQIPTSWDIVLDLIRKIGYIEGHDCGEHPDQWFLDTYQQEPGYSFLLEQLAGTPAERNQIIRGYIEPTEEQRDIGLKGPTDAHRAIAELVSGGFVRVVTTTNFDRLLETALGEFGIVPEVIGDGDQCWIGCHGTHSRWAQKNREACAGAHRPSRLGGESRLNGPDCCRRCRLGCGVVSAPDPPFVAHLVPVPSLGPRAHAGALG